MKRIVFTKPNIAELLDYEIGEPGEHEVQVALSVSTISSGTERANIMGSTTVAWNRPEAEKAVFPRYNGYSSAGIITKLGDGVEGFAVGDRVALSWTTHTQVLNIKARFVHKLDRLKLSDLVEEVHSPEEATAVYTRLCEEKTFPLVQFDWSELK